MDLSKAIVSQTILRVEQISCAHAMGCLLTKRYVSRSISFLDAYLQTQRIDLQGG